MPMISIIKANDINVKMIECQWRHCQWKRQRSIDAIGFIDTIGVIDSSMVSLISMCNGAFEMWKTHHHSMVPLAPMTPLESMLPLSPLAILSPLVPLYDQCIIIVSKGSSLGSLAPMFMPLSPLVTIDASDFGWIS